MSKHELLILCGGQGTRLSSVWQKPKILAPIGNKTYLQILLNTLGKVDCDINITLATGYKSEIIEEEVYRLGLQISILTEKTKLGTGGAITNFLKDCHISRFSVLNGDTLFSETDLHNFFNRTLQINKCLVATQNISLNDRFGSVNTSPNLSFKKPFFPLKDDLVYAGLATFVTAMICTRIETPCSLDKLINISNINKESVELFRLKSEFHDIGTPESLASAKKWLQKN